MHAVGRLLCLLHRLLDDNRAVSGHAEKNLWEVQNQAPKFGMPEEMEARFARTALGGETLGLSLMKLAPGFRIPFGHKHAGQEEVYVIVRGSARIKVEDEIVELGEWDAIRFDKDTMRNVEAGPEGVEYLAFGAGDDPRDAEMVAAWWSES
jgi:mannose-6-phosphate isomerase-like protein (cupin superfamily)